jgi:hypothetical protein
VYRSPFRAQSFQRRMRREALSHIADSGGACRKPPRVPGRRKTLKP